MNTAVLLDQPRLSLITRAADDELRSIQDVVAGAVLVDGRADVEAILSELARHDGPRTLKTLDLIGHSTPDHSLLMLGDWVIDGTKSRVASYFRGLADCDVLSRLGIHSIRLLGCQTAESELARQTLTTLAEIVEIEVYGTTQMIHAAHYDAAGFRAESEHTLLPSSDLRSRPQFSAVKRGGEPYRRVFDVELLPSAPLGIRPLHPRVIADVGPARRILQLIRRTDGAQMPGLLTTPSCEIALPSNKPGWYHRIQMLLDGEFVRIYPDGDDRPGVLFPVDDPAGLRSIVVELPLG